MFFFLQKKPSLDLFRPTFFRGPWWWSAREFWDATKRWPFLSKHSQRIEGSRVLNPKCQCLGAAKNSLNTLPETNIAPKNGWLEYYFPIGKAYFQGQAVSFRECKPLVPDGHFLGGGEVAALKWVSRRQVLPVFSCEGWKS